MPRPHPSRWGMGIGNLVMGWNYSLYAPDGAVGFGASAWYRVDGWQNKQNQYRGLALLAFQRYSQNGSTVGSPAGTVCFAIQLRLLANAAPGVCYFNHKVKMNRLGLFRFAQQFCNTFAAQKCYTVRFCIF
jgi:hypothetical protein